MSFKSLPSYTEAYTLYDMKGLLSNPDYIPTLVNASVRDKKILQANFINYSQLHRFLIKEYIKKENLAGLA